MPAKYYKLLAYVKGTGNKKTLCKWEIPLHRVFFFIESFSASAEHTAAAKSVDFEAGDPSTSILMAGKSAKAANRHILASLAVSKQNSTAAPQDAALF